MEKLITYALGLGLLTVGAAFPARGAVHDVRMNPNPVFTEPTAVTPVPEAATVVAGVLLLLPFGLCALRSIRKSHPDFTHPCNTRRR
jgi:hypothetical protein